jgi:cobalt/nickel transport protein
VSAPAQRSRVSLRGFLVAGVLVSLLLAAVVSSLASSSPDGLDTVTLDGCTVDDQGEISGGRCAAQNARDSAAAASPLAGYGVSGVDGPVSTGLAGAVGVLVTFGLMLLLLRIVRGRGRQAAGPEPAAPGGGAAGRGR